MPITPLPSVFNNSDLQVYSSEKLFITHFEEKLPVFNNKPALNYSDGKLFEAVATLNYQQLNQHVLKLASFIYSKKSERQSTNNTPFRVGIYLNRSPDAVIAILACMKAGASFVALEYDTNEGIRANPRAKERFELGLRVAKLDVLLTYQTFAAELDLTQQRLNYPVSCLDTPEFRAQINTMRLPADIPAPSLRDEAYGVLSSGSTGEPKVIRLPHEAILGRVLAGDYVMRRGRTIGDLSIGCYPPMSVDTSTWDIFHGLAVGGCVHIVPKNSIEGLGALYSFCEKNRIQILSLVPTVWQKLDFNKLPYLHTLLTTGEAFHDRTSLDAWLAAAPANQPRRVINGYGPSETTYGLTLAEYEPNRPIVLGASMSPLTRIYIAKHELTEFQRIEVTADLTTDKQFECMPYFSTTEEAGDSWGEIWAEGSGLALGYLNDLHGKNARRFLEKVVNGQTRKFYRTGDKARYIGNEANHWVELGGRWDKQFKHLGLLVAPEEIEQRLVADNPELIEKAIVCKPEGCKQIIAMIFTRDRRRLRPSNLRDIAARLHGKLPSHMYPGLWCVNPQENDAWKTATPRLSELSNLQQISDLEHYLPTNIINKPFSQLSEIQDALTLVWQNVLFGENFMQGQEPGEFISINSNFSHLGGDSSSFIIMRARVEEHFKGLDWRLFSIKQTLEYLAQMIYIQAKAIEANALSSMIRPLIQLQDNQRKPWFMIHAINGCANTLYQDIARTLSELNTSSCYGLDPLLKQTEGEAALWDEVPLDAGFELLAKLYAAAIIAKEPTGPYYIAGCSTGGLIAHQVAHAIKRVNPNSVVALVLLDPIASHIVQNMTPNDFARYWYTMLTELLPNELKRQDIISPTDDLTFPGLSLDIMSSKKPLEQLQYGVSQCLDDLIEQEYIRNTQVDKLAKTKNLLKIIYLLAKATLQEHNPIQTELPTLLIPTENTLRQVADSSYHASTLGWQQTASLQISASPIAGEHKTMLGGNEKVEAIARAMHDFRSTQEANVRSSLDAQSASDLTPASSGPPRPVAEAIITRNINTAGGVCLTNEAEEGDATLIVSAQTHSGSRGTTIENHAEGRAIAHVTGRHTSDGDFVFKNVAGKKK